MNKLRLLTARDTTSRWWWLTFLLGFLWSLLMAWRSQVDGDQRLLLELGWPLIDHGEWLQYGMPTSAGGRSPGGLMSLLMALPLWIWRDYRAPAFFLALLHAGAFLLLRRCVRPTLTAQGEWLLLLLVWLNPWRMYFSAHMWNANFMFAIAVLYLWLAQRMQQRSFATSLAMPLLIALGMQIHTSAMLLAIASLLLWWKQLIRVNWTGIAIGALLSVAAYTPWIIAVSQHPELRPGEKGFLLRGLIYIFPLLRGVLYWLEMPSLSFASRMIQVDFVDLPARLNAVFKPIAIAIGIFAHVTLLPVIYIQWRFFKRRSRWLRTHWQRSMASDQSRTWLRRYITVMAIAAVLSFCVSPTTVMFWQAFIILPVSALVIIFFAQSALLTTRHLWIQRSITAWSILTYILLLSQTFGGPLYRCGGSYFGDMDERLTALHVDPRCNQPE